MAIYSLLRFEKKMFLLPNSGLWGAGDADELVGGFPSLNKQQQFEE